MGWKIPPDPETGRGTDTMNRKCTAAVLSAMLALTGFAAVAPAKPQTSVNGNGTASRWESEAPVFYFVHPGGPLEFRVKVFKAAPGFRGDPSLKVTESALVTLAGPDETMVKKQYWRKRGQEDSVSFDWKFPDAAAGVWQLRASLSQNSRLALEFETSPKLPFGVLFSRCKIYGSDFRNLKKSFFVVPEPQRILNGPAEKHPLLRLTSCAADIDVFDRNGKFLFSDSRYSVDGAMPDSYGNSFRRLPAGADAVPCPPRGAELTLSEAEGAKRTLLKTDPDSGCNFFPETGKLYSLEVNGPQEGWITVEGMPVILCPTPETARAIGGSVVRDPADGRWYPHRFQVETARWIRSLTPEDLRVEAIPLAARRAEWLADPANTPFIIPFAHAPHLFRIQNTAMPEQSVRYNDSGVNLDPLTLFYALDRPFNPYFRNRAVMNRLFLYYLKKWLALTESGFMWDDPRGYYCGGTEWSGAEGMLFFKDSAALAYAAPYADPRLTRLLRTGLELNLHRLWSTRLSCENQSLHWPFKIYALYRITGEKMYLEMARDSLADLADPALSESSKTGYLMEAWGPDATYMGISTSFLALAMRWSGDDAAMPVLERAFDLMSHTVTREPDGTLRGVNAFGHRTLGTWLSRQYDGGAELLSDRLESAALVNRRKSFTQADLEREFAHYSAPGVPEKIETWRKSGDVLFGYSFASFDRIWRGGLIPMGKDIQNPRTPAEKSGPFERNFNGEFVAKRTGAYYAFFHTGNTSGRFHQWRSMSGILPEGTKLENGVLVSSEASRPWLPVQGLNLFWTPGFGQFVSGHNWSMYTHQLLRLDREGRCDDFTENCSCESEISGGRIVLRQKMKKEGVRIRREYEMTENGVKVSLKASAPEKIRRGTLVEQIPYLKKAGLVFSPMKGKITSLRASLPSGACVVLNFSRPVEVREGPVSKAVFNPSDLRIGVLEIQAVPEFDGTPAAFEYEIGAGTR